MLILSVDVDETVNRVIFWGVNVGVAGFSLGLVAQSASLKRIFTPILGLALLFGIYSYLKAGPREQGSEGVPVASSEVGEDSGRRTGP